MTDEHSDRPDDDRPKGDRPEDSSSDFQSPEDISASGDGGDAASEELEALRAEADRVLEELGLADGGEIDTETLLEALGVFDDINTRPIPTALHSAYSAKPFERCSSCNTVLDETTIYQIEKVYHGSETIFEMAICYDCASDLGDEISEESAATLQSFLRELLRGRHSEDCCQSCGRGPDTLNRRSVNAMCRGDKLIMPLVIVCEDCETALQSSLSQQTRDSHDEFIRDNFPGVPEGIDLSPLRMF